MRCLNVKKKNLKLYKISKPKEIIIVIFRERINQISYLISFHSLEWKYEFERSAHKLYAKMYKYLNNNYTQYPGWIKSTTYN